MAVENSTGQGVSGIEPTTHPPKAMEVPKAPAVNVRCTTVQCPVGTVRDSGGCDAKAMSDQGRTCTPGVPMAQFLEGTAPSVPVSQAAATVARESATEDSTFNAGKRTAVFLNVALLPHQADKLRAQGVTALTVQRFGAFQEPVSTLMQVKRLIREGRGSGSRGV